MWFFQPNNRSWLFAGKSRVLYKTKSASTSLINRLSMSPKFTLAIFFICRGIRRQRRRKCCCWHVSLWVIVECKVEMSEFLSYGELWLSWKLVNLVRPIGFPGRECRVKSNWCESAAFGPLNISVRLWGHWFSLFPKQPSGFARVRAEGFICKRNASCSTAT